MLAIPAKYLGNLMEHYRSHHEISESIPVYMGIVGASGYSLFYLLRFTRPDPQPFDDLGLRLVAVVLCLLMALRRFWPQQLKPHYLAYSYWALLYCLPFHTVYVALTRHGGTPSMSNTFIVIFLLVLATDWRNTIVMAVAGTALAVLAYWLTDPAPSVPWDYVAQVPAYILIIIGGSLFKFSEKQVQAQKIHMATALAGSIAHEMRNPLAQIKFSLRSVMQTLPSPTATTAPQLIAADRLGYLYEQLGQGDLAIERGLQVISMTLDQVKTRQIDTSDFVYLSAARVTRKAIDEYGYASNNERDKVRFNVRSDFIFKGHETTYLFVVFNLLKNALYYLAVRPQACITITVDRFCVSVHDTGPGIAKDLLPSLFEPFRTSGKSTGTGLGLAYCRRVMRAFGGDISCQSVYGESTEFRLHFPEWSHSQIDSHEQALLQRAAEVMSGKRVLLVDDEASLRRTVRQMLGDTGCQIDEAVNGQAAIQALAQAHYDLIVMDLSMPVLDGYAATERIRQGAIPGSERIPIVAYTSEPAYIADIKTRRVGMNAFVAKPCSRMELVETLQHVLRREAARPDAARSASSLSGRLILVADDTPFNRAIVRSYLERRGAQVIEAEHGRAALRQLDAQHGIDAILMDLSMPEMDGLEATRIIRSRESHPYSRIPIIALTGESGERLKTAIAAGVNDFIIKPVDSDTLYKKLDQWLLLAQPQSPGEGATHEDEPGNISLLHRERLEEFERLDLLGEVGEALKCMTELLERLQAGEARRDMADVSFTLHKLLSLSGNAGAFAVHQFIYRQLYPQIRRGEWPAQADWLKTLEQLNAQTRQAIQKDYPGAQAAPHVAA
ncbi:MAG: response regulator [Burkholderiaceae bacterium]|nr:response regulator [Burkholderiaceae bacterium]